MDGIPLPEDQTMDSSYGNVPSMKRRDQHHSRQNPFPYRDRSRSHRMNDRDHDSGSRRMNDMQDRPSGSHHMNDNRNRSGSQWMHDNRNQRHYQSQNMPHYSSGMDSQSNLYSNYQKPPSQGNFQGSGSYENYPRDFQSYPQNCPNYPENFNMQRGYEMPPVNNPPQMYQPQPINQQTIPPPNPPFPFVPPNSVGPTAFPSFNPSPFTLPVTNTSLNPPPIPPTNLLKIPNPIMPPLPPTLPPIESYSKVDSASVSTTKPSVNELPIPPPLEAPLPKETENASTEKIDSTINIPTPDEADNANSLPTPDEAGNADSMPPPNEVVPADAITTKEVVPADPMPPPKEVVPADPMPPPKEVVPADPMPPPKEVIPADPITTPNEVEHTGTDPVPTPNEVEHTDSMPTPNEVEHADSVPTPDESAKETEISKEINELTIEAPEVLEKEETKEPEKKEEKPETKMEVESPLDSLVQAVSKQIETTNVSKANEQATKKEIEATPEKKSSPLKKLNLPCLSKEAAKARLKSFSAAKTFMKDKLKTQVSSILDDNEDSSKALSKDSTAPEEEKKDIVTKKKKKKEKVSVIEQIRDEETRIKEALSISNTMIPSLGFGIPDINNLLDNPEALKKFETSRKNFQEKLEKGEIGSGTPKRISRSSRERERRSSKSSHGENSQSTSRGETSRSTSQGDSKSYEESTSKGKDSSSSRKSKDDRKKDSSESSRYSEHKSSKIKLKEMPRSWKEMRDLNLKIENIPRNLRYRSRSRSRSISPRSRRSGRRSSRSWSRERSSGRNQRIFPDLPKYFQHFSANRAQSSGTKEYRASLVQYTQSKPCITYCIDSNKYNNHMWTRNELKIRNRNRPEVMKIIEDFWKSQKYAKPTDNEMPSRLHFDCMVTIENWISDNTQEELSLSKAKKTTALDYLTSSYKADMPPQPFEKDEKESSPEVSKLSPSLSFNEESTDKSISLEDISSPENKQDSQDDMGSPEKIEPIEFTEEAHNISTPTEMDIDVIPHCKEESPIAETESKPVSSKTLDTKLTVQELNEEYEAFINTLEFKAEECLSEDTFDFNESNLSFEETLILPKEEKPKEFDWLDNPPKSKKEVKKLLLNPKLGKKQRKALKRLKKKLKKEKKEKKRLKKELKKKRKAERKMKKKQEKLRLKRESLKEEFAIPEEEEFKLIPQPEFLNEESSEPSKHPDESMEEYQVLEWEDYNDSGTEETNEVKEKEESVIFLPKSMSAEEQEQVMSENSNMAHSANENSNPSYDETSGFYESSYSPQSKTETSSLPSPLSKVEEEEEEEREEREQELDNYEEPPAEEELPDTYSPSTMSVCSIDSPPNKISSPYSPPSPEHYSHPPEHDKHYNYQSSPYSPSSPQGSNSDPNDQEKKEIVSSLDNIPMPPSTSALGSDSSFPSAMTEMFPQTDSKFEDNASARGMLPKDSLSPKSCPVDEVPTKGDVDSSTDDTSPFKKTSQPVTFRLSLTKQSAGLKRLQKTLLPGFIQNDDEDDRRSPLFDIEDSHNTPRMDKPKLTPLSPLHKKMEKETPKESEARGLSKKEPKEEFDKKKETSRSPSPKRTSREKEKSYRRLHSTSKESEDDRRSSRSTKESERVSEKLSSKNSSVEVRDTLSPPKRRERRKEMDSSIDSKRRKRSRSPPSTRVSSSKAGNSSSVLDYRGYRSRSRSPPPSRTDRPRSPSCRDLSRSPSPDKYGAKGSRSDARSQSPASKWKRIKSPPPRRLRGKSPPWGHKNDDRSRYSASREDDRPKSSYSPRSNRRGHLRQSKSPDRIKEMSPFEEPAITIKEEKRGKHSPPRRSQETSKFSDFSARPIDSISNLFPPSRNESAWDWTEGSDTKDFYPREESTLPPRSPRRETKKRSFSPDLSPKRISLDERLKQEHGVEIQKEALPPQADYHRQGYYWEYNPPPVQVPPPKSAAGEAQVVRVGNVLEVRPQSVPEKSYEERAPVPVKRYEERSPVPVKSYEERSPAPVKSYEERSPVPVKSYEERSPVPVKSYEGRSPVPVIVQSGNIIEVNFQSPVSSQKEPKEPPSAHHEEKLPPPPTSKASTLKSGAEIAPVPPPSSSITSNPLAFISSLLASSMSQPLASTEASSSVSTPPVTVGEVPPSPCQSPAKEPPPQSPVKTSIDQRPSEPVAQPPESPLPGLDSQQQQAIISAAVAAAASGVTASNLPIAHLISVLQQQSLLSQPLVQPTPVVTQEEIVTPTTLTPAPIPTPIPIPTPSPVPTPTPIPTSSPIPTPTKSQPSAESAKEVKSKVDLRAFKKAWKERKERKKIEKELRRKARKEKSLFKKLAMEEEQSAKEQEEAKKAEAEMYDYDDVVMKEAMTEVPELGSPIPEYEIYNDDEFPEDEEEEEKKPPFGPLPSPPEKGILIGPSYRILRNKTGRKSVSFADGVMPGYGTSPSGGEEIHSPPPPNSKPEKKEKKKVRKKKKVKVRIIKQFELGSSRMDSPPPPPETPPTSGVLKLYPGCTHYTCTAPNTFVIYTQQPIKPNGADLGIAGGGTVTIPPGMLIHSSALSKGAVPEGIAGAMGTSIPPSMPHSYPTYDFPVYPERKIDQGTPLLQSPLA